MLKEKDILNVCIAKLKLTKLKNDVKKSEIDYFRLDFEIDTPERIRANACVYLRFIVQNGGCMLTRRSTDLKVMTRCWLVVDLGEDGRRADVESYLEK